MMEEGKSKRDWAWASCIMAVIANANRSGKRAPLKPADFNPYAKKVDQVIQDSQTGFDAMKALFTKKGKRHDA